MVVFFDLWRNYLIVLIPIIPGHYLALLNIGEIVQKLKFSLISWDLNILNQRMNISIHNWNDFFSFSLTRTIMFKLQKSLINKHLSLATNRSLFILLINSTKISYNSQSHSLWSLSLSSFYLTSFSLWSNSIPILTKWS